MFKDFLYELFGLTLVGQGFEIALWLVLIVFGIWSGVRVWRDYRKDKEADSEAAIRQGDLMRLLVAMGLVGFGAWNLIQSLAFGALFFSEPLVLHTYGVAIALGFAVAVWVGAREAKRTGLDVTRLLDLSFWVLVSALVGSRVVFMIVERDVYYARCVDPASVGLSAPDCMAVLRFWEGGLVFYGGLIGAVTVGLYYLKKHKLDVWRYADVGAVSIPLGQFFGRLGCFSAGCCHGKYIPSDHALGVHWPAKTAAYDVVLADLPGGAERSLFLENAWVTAHPTQLYESGAALCLFIALMLLRTRRRFAGQLLIVYIVSYAIIRSVIEVFRGDKIREYVFELPLPAVSAFLGLPLEQPVLLSTSQFIALLTIVGALGLWIWRRRDARRLPSVGQGA
jgi:phosphatidylglycerol:prolipoprotein diacylglycerol transferase